MRDDNLQHQYRNDASRSDVTMATKPDSHPCRIRYIHRTVQYQSGNTPTTCGWTETPGNNDQHTKPPANLHQLGNTNLQLKL